MVKIRLARFGSKHNPHYRIVVTDAEGKCAYTNAYFVADLLEKKEN